MKEIIKNIVRKGGLVKTTRFQEVAISWAQAERSVSGYSDPAILGQVREALAQVRDGAAEYERDGVIFPEIQYSWPVLSSLLLAAAQNNGALRVVDFGGSLGTTYFQNRKFLEHLDHVEWRVIEQPRFVEIGDADFSNHQLSFDTDFKRSLDEVKPTVVLLSSSLQYVQGPDRALGEASLSSADHIIIDRTPFHSGDSHILTIQTVPPSVYKAKYAAWILSRRQLHGVLSPNWEPLLSFESLGGLARTEQGTQFSWEGILLRRVPN